MMNRYILIVLSLILMSGLAIAAEDGLIYKAGNPIEMKTSCIINGSYCSPTTVCNITIVYPQTGDIYINNKQLQNQISFYNLTLPYTNQLGEYNAKVVCFDPTVAISGTQDFTFKVTTTGTTSNGNMTIFIFALAVAVIILIISLLLANIYLGFLSGITFTLSGLYNNIYGIGIENNVYTIGLGMVIMAVGATIMLMCGYNAMKEDNGFRLGGNANDGFDENDTFNYTQEKEADD
jgi:hypothetical protein